MILIAGLTLAGAGTALAHHGWAGYGEAQFELTGTITGLSLGQPRGEILLEVDVGVWEVVLGPANRNRRAGITEEAIALGDEVTAIGRRHRDPAVLEIKSERPVKDDRVFDIYPERLPRDGTS